GQIAGTFNLVDDGLALLHETKTFGNMLLFGSANAVAVTESVTAGFTQSASCTINDPGVGGGSASTSGIVATVVPAEGMVATCTYVNKRANGTLTIVKHVVNDNGGTALASSFTMTVTGGGQTVCTNAGAEEPGFNCSLPGGTYVVSESSLSGYTFAGFSGNCNSSGSVTVPAGGTAKCTLTNDDLAATLTVIKHVIINNGRIKT